MGLIPAVINDGVADRTIVLRGQQPMPNSVKTEYFEPGSALVIQTEHAIPKNRSTLQRSVIRVSQPLVVNADGDTSPCNINISYARDSRHVEADVVKLITVALASLPTSDAKLSFVRRLP